MFRKFLTLRPILRNFIVVKKQPFFSGSWNFTEHKDLNASFLKSDSTETSTIGLSPDTTARVHETNENNNKNGANTETETALNNEANAETDASTSIEKSQEYDPDWYVHSEEDDLPLASEEKEGFTPRWLKSSQESSDEGYIESKVIPAELSKELFEPFFVEQRAADFSYIDISGKCEWASGMIIVQGQSLRHIQALSDTTRRFIKRCRIHDPLIPDILSLEGDVNDEWIALDAGKIVFHFMTAEARKKYSIEEIWTNHRDSSLEILQQLSETSDQELKEELAAKLQESVARSWEKKAESNTIFESEDELNSLLSDTPYNPDKAPEDSSKQL